MWGTPTGRQPTQRQSLRSVSVPAPIGGINTVDPGLAMPATDCIYAYNLISDVFGLRTRLGFQEWCTGLTGGADNTVRTVAPFSASNPTNDKLFACTSSGIWDATNSSSSPSELVTWPTGTGSAGYGITTVATSLAGRFCLLTDEANGLYIYNEGGSWAAAVSGVAASWRGDTAVALGVQIVNDGNIYVVSTAGVTSTNTPPTGTGTGITDGTAKWDYVSAAVANVIGPSLDDQNNGLSLDVTKLVFVVVWKSRVWLVEKNTTRAWYLGVNAVYGEATSFNFGARMKTGGPLVGLFNWSYDGGSGIDTHLVGLSTEGDVVIYSGTDPTSATTFGLTGCWSVGAVPSGRRICVDYGGDLLVMSALGVVPLSKLVVGQPVVGGSRSPYATGKIGNLFNQLVLSYGALDGWAIHIHPTDNALLLLVPQQTPPATSYLQLAMSFATQGWTQYRNLPMVSAGIFGGQLYFGTSDGRVCLNSGYVDNVLLGSGDFTPIAWSLLTAYTNMGNAQQKQVKMVRPNMTSDGPFPQAVPTVKYGFDLTEPAPPAYSPPVAGPGTWDGSTWDTTLWGGALAPYQVIWGGFGMGREVAIALRGAAIARTILVAVDVFFETGGML